MSRLHVAEQRLLAAVRSPAARIAGAVVGVLALASVVQRLYSEDTDLVAIFTDVGLAGAVVLLVAFAIFHAMAVATLHELDAPDAAWVWGISQFVKYIPVPGSALAGMAGAAVRGGHGGRDAIQLVLISSLARLGAGMTVGAWAIVAWLEWSSGLEWAAVIGIAAVGVVLGVRTGGVLAFGYSVAGWLVAGAAIGGVLGPGTALEVGAAYVLAWVAGQLAVPVPAGIGVREVAMTALLAPVVGTSAAAALAVSSRLVHTASDLAIAGVVTLRRGRPGGEGSQPGSPGRTHEIDESRGLHR